LQEILAISWADSGREPRKAIFSVPKSLSNLSLAQKVQVHILCWVSSKRKTNGFIMKEHLTGLIAAPPTPMFQDGSLNLAVVEKQARCLIENGIKAAFVCGSTGEGLSLSTTERMQVAERWKAVVGDRLPILVHAGHHSLVEARVLAEHAEKKIAARAIATMAPSYFKPETIDDLVCFCAEVAAAAPQTPFYYYHQPANSGVHFPMVDFVRIAGERIETFAGIKYTHGDMMDFGQCLDLQGGRFNILMGQDENLLVGLALGARGAIGSTYNFAAPLYQRITNSYEAGDMATAQKEQGRARELVSVITRFGLLPALKATMKIIGIDCGPCRLPLRTLSDKKCEELAGELERIGFFGYCSKVAQ
jgi:N-acetylneuraminate lyase